MWDDVQNSVVFYQGNVVDGRLSELNVIETHIPDLTISPLERELNHFIESVVNRTQPKSDANNAITVAKLIDEIATYLH